MTVKVYSSHFGFSQFQALRRRVGANRRGRQPEVHCICSILFVTFAKSPSFSDQQKKVKRPGKSGKAGILKWDIHIVSCNSNFPNCPQASATSSTKSKRRIRGERARKGLVGAGRGKGKEKMAFEVGQWAICFEKKFMQLCYTNNN